MARVLVTSETGFVAGWCIVELLEAGHDVVCTVRSPGRADAVRAAIATRADRADALTFALADLTAQRCLPGAAHAPPAARA
jgi:uncharacterized protein YbjT (DUF2867 family)